MGRGLRVVYTRHTIHLLNLGAHVQQWLLYLVCVCVCVCVCLSVCLLPLLCYPRLLGGLKETFFLKLFCCIDGAFFDISLSDAVAHTVMFYVDPNFALFPYRNALRASQFCKPSIFCVFEKMAKPTWFIPE